MAINLNPSVLYIFHFCSSSSNCSGFSISIFPILRSIHFLFNIYCFVLFRISIENDFSSSHQHHICTYWYVIHGFIIHSYELTERTAFFPPLLLLLFSTLFCLGSVINGNMRGKCLPQSSISRGFLTVVLKSINKLLNA